MTLFFLALLFAAWTSLVALIELPSRILIDLGMSRSRAIALVGVAGFLFGIPSAYNWTSTPGSGPFFANQDWVWGVGLMLSGFFFAFAVLKYGISEWREKYINTGDSDIYIGAWWDWAIRFVMLESVVLMVWWLYQSQGESFRETWTLFSPLNIGTVLIQWSVVLIVLIASNKWLSKKMLLSMSSADSGHHSLGTDGSID
jgi:NSS family neurotransmitter:Na+ symporter